MLRYFNEPAGDLTTNEQRLITLMYIHVASRNYPAKTPNPQTPTLNQKSNTQIPIS